jgi:ribosomal subunit interface protein
VQIIIRGQNVPVSDALVAHCIERVSRGFRPFSSRISRVQFVLVDLNGPKHGVGHACRATVDLSHGGHVRYEGRAADFYQALSQTVAGIARPIQRALVRRRSHAVDRSSTARPAA